MGIRVSLILICYNTYTKIKERKQMSIHKINRHVYETIVFVKELPYNLSTGKDADKIKQAILERFETIPKRYRQKVFQTLDSKARRYDSIGYNLWHPYIRQIRNSGQGPLFR